MRTRRGNFTEDRTTIFRLKTQSKTSVENSVSIPVDIIFEILLRLPAKSIATCRCVSKLWNSVICSPYFTELFLTRSLHRPQLLFSCEKDGKLFFFSSPQLQNPDENSSATSLMSFPFSSQISQPVHGLVCLTHKKSYAKERVKVICNPSTGHSLTLPKWTTRIGVRTFFVYEPIEKQFKVLLSYESEEHQVLTLGTREESSWRTIECSILHYPAAFSDEICINGVLYYSAINLYSGDNIIVCFDASSEKFRFIRVMEDFIRAAREGTLINYNGKLASLVSERDRFVDGSSTSIELWVVQDVEKHEWSKHTFELPALWLDIAGTVDFRFVGVTRTNEIMLSPCCQTVPFYVFYFNIENKTMKRVAIHGMEACEGNIVFSLHISRPRRKLKSNAYVLVGTFLFLRSDICNRTSLGLGSYHMTMGSYYCPYR